MNPSFFPPGPLTRSAPTSFCGSPAPAIADSAFAEQWMDHVQADAADACPHLPLRERLAALGLPAQGAICRDAGSQLVDLLATIAREPCHMPVCTNRPAVVEIVQFGAELACVARRPLAATSVHFSILVGRTALLVLPHGVCLVCLRAAQSAHPRQRRMCALSLLEIGADGSYAVAGTQIAWADATPPRTPEGWPLDDNFFGASDAGGSAQNAFSPVRGPPSPPPPDRRPQPAEQPAKRFRSTLSTALTPRQLHELLSTAAPPAPVLKRGRSPCAVLLNVVVFLRRARRWVGEQRGDGDWLTAPLFVTKGKTCGFCSAKAGRSSADRHQRTFCADLFSDQSEAEAQLVAALWYARGFDAEIMSDAAIRAAAAPAARAAAAPAPPPVVPPELATRRLGEWAAGKLGDRVRCYRVARELWAQMVATLETGLGDLRCSEIPGIMSAGTAEAPAAQPADPDRAAAVLAALRPPPAKDDRAALLSSTDSALDLL